MWYCLLCCICKSVLTAFVESVPETLECTIQVKNFEKYFHVVLFIMLYMQVGSNSVC